MITGLLFIIAGVVLACFGRRLIYLVFTLVGFGLGYLAAQLVLPGEFEPTTHTIICIVTGLVFAIAALWFKKFTLSMLGFLTLGTALVFGLRTSLGESLSLTTTLLAFFSGGVIGAVLVTIVYDWALVFLSAYGGSMLIVRGTGQLIDLNRDLSLAVLILITILGVVIQAGSVKRRHLAT